MFIQVQVHVEWCEKLYYLSVILPWTQIWSGDLRHLTAQASILARSALSSSGIKMLVLSAKNLM